MPQSLQDCRWGVLGHSQLGASHVRQGLPNQDAFSSYVLPDGSPPAILCLADGHGSAKSFRSDVGAALAVDITMQVCREFLKGISGATPSAVKKVAEEQIPPRIFQVWRRRVTEHFTRNPFTETELDRLSAQAGAAARARVACGEDHQVAYGTTLLAALLTNEFLICFQLGDGEILTVADATGEVGRAVPKDESLIANETTSLCQDGAQRFVRCRFQLFQDYAPGLVLLTTDGYPNSFATPDAFLKVGTDYLDMLRSDGADAVQQGLPQWLEETSRDGSGDDITLGIIYRCHPPLVKPPVPSQGTTSASPTPGDDRPGEKPGDDGDSAAVSEPPVGDTEPPALAAAESFGTSATQGLGSNIESLREPTRTDAVEGACKEASTEQPKPGTQPSGDAAEENARDSDTPP
jgi:Protein phosphatase 2C